MTNKERIRQRRSYRTFEQLLRFLNRRPSKRSMLRRLYKELDGAYAFGSCRNSVYAHESVELLIKDRRL